MSRFNFRYTPVYIAFDGTSYYGLYDFDVDSAKLEDPYIEIVEGPFDGWPDDRIEELNNQI